MNLVGNLALYYVRNYMGQSELIGTQGDSRNVGSGEVPGSPAATSPQEPMALSSTPPGEGTGHYGASDTKSDSSDATIGDNTTIKINNKKKRQPNKKKKKKTCAQANLGRETPQHLEDLR